MERPIKPFRAMKGPQGLYKVLRGFEGPGNLGTGPRALRAGPGPGSSGQGPICCSLFWALIVGHRGQPTMGRGAGGQRGILERPLEGPEALRKLPWKALRLEVAKSVLLYDLKESQKNENKCFFFKLYLGKKLVLETD